MDVALAVSLGVLAGVLAGLLGVGGGILFVPALAIFLGLDQVQAEATSLLAIIPVSAVGALRQHRYGNVRVADGLLVGVLSALGVLAGVALANALPARVLELAFAGLTLGIAQQVFRRGLRRRRERLAAIETG
jgi:uncharacterized membrane protein YfcA